MVGRVDDRHALERDYCIWCCVSHWINAEGEYWASFLDLRLRAHRWGFSVVVVGVALLCSLTVSYVAPPLRHRPRYARAATAQTQSQAQV